MILRVRCLFWSRTSTFCVSGLAHKASAAQAVQTQTRATSHSDSMIAKVDFVDGSLSWFMRCYGWASWAEFETSSVSANVLSTEGPFRLCARMPVRVLVMFAFQLLI